MRDLYNNLKILRVLSPAAGGTTGTGRTSGVIDRRGYDSLVFAAEYGAITATAATMTLTVLEGDTTGGSFASVADDDLLGTEADASIAAGTPRASGTNMHIAKKIGYKGVKRYLKVKVVPTSTAASPVSVLAIMGHADQAPVA